MEILLSMSEENIQFYYCLMVWVRLKQSFSSIVFGINTPSQLQHLLGGSMQPFGL